MRLIFHPKQLMLVSAGNDADVRVWDLVTKSCVATLKVQALPFWLPIAATQLLLSAVAPRSTFPILVCQLLLHVFCT